MNIVLPDDVNYIINTIQQAGYEAYVVGGCVRDALLHKQPDDWDITTSAKPNIIKELFPHTIDTGLQHGTVTVRVHHTNYEVTTYRIDEDYIDGRHPNKVTFTNLLSEDLKRRDFTINAIAYNPTAGLIDLFSGQSDLENKIIRCVGNPTLRFEEDALRILRALRFSAQLNFTIHEETLDAITNCSHLLTKISAERIHTELTKLLVSNHPEVLKIAYNSKVTRVILPEFDTIMATMQNNPHHCYTVGEHTLEALKSVSEDPILRYAMLFHDMGKPSCKTTDQHGIDHFHGHQIKSKEIAHSIMKRLKFDTRSMTLIERCVEHHDLRLEPTQRAVRRAIAKLGVDLFPYLFEIQKADILAQSTFQRDKKLNTLSQVKSIYNLILEEQDCLTIKDLAIHGQDLLEIGFTPGPIIGQILQALLEYVLEHPEKNTKEDLISYTNTNFSNLTI